MVVITEIGSHQCNKSIVVFDWVHFIFYYCISNITGCPILKRMNIFCCYSCVLHSMCDISLKLSTFLVFTLSCHLGCVAMCGRNVSLLHMKCRLIFIRFHSVTPQKDRICSQQNLMSLSEYWHSDVACFVVSPLYAVDWWLLFSHYSRSVVEFCTADVRNVKCKLMFHTKSFGTLFTDILCVSPVISPLPLSNHTCFMGWFVSDSSQWTDWTHLTTCSRSRTRASFLVFVEREFAGCLTFRNLASYI